MSYESQESVNFRRPLSLRWWEKKERIHQIQWCILQHISILLTNPEVTGKHSEDSQFLTINFKWLGALENGLMLFISHIARGQLLWGHIHGLLNVSWHFYPLTTLSWGNTLWWLHVEL